MGCGSSSSKIVPESAPTTCAPTRRLFTKVILSSTEHIVQLFTTNQISESTCSTYEQRECDMREAYDKKYKEYADLLENPHLNIVPKER